jgi:uncharacterized protein
MIWSRHLNNVLPPVLFIVAFTILSTQHPALSTALEVPPLTGRVVDLAEILPADVEARVSDLLAEQERRTGNQIAVLTVRSLVGEALEDYAHRVASAWALGRKGTDNGVLILVAPNDRGVRIEVGYGLEGALTDVKASRIIRREMIPQFRAGSYAAGVEAGVRAVIATIDGTYQAPEEPAAPGGHETVLMAIFAGVVVGAVIGVGIRIVGALVGGGLSFVMALAAGMGLAMMAGVVGFIGALVLSALLSAGGGGRSARWWRGGPWIGGSGWPSGDWSSRDSFGGMGGTFGGGGASGRW